MKSNHLLACCIKTLLCLLVFVFVFVCSPIYADEGRTIYLSRHAEKLKQKTSDPGLSVKGKGRARMLAEKLADKNIQAIYVTHYQRTIQTALPLAEKLGLKVIEYNPRQLQKFAEKLLKLNTNILVVGHSNTTPELVRLLGGKDFGEISEQQYDRLYKLSFRDKVVQSRLLKTTTQASR